MKKNRFLFAAVLCVALAFGFSACENPNNNDLLNQIEDLKNKLDNLNNGKDKSEADKDGDKKNPSDNGNREENSDSEQGSYTDYNGHAYVDLGLPSGLKWATCNVGATSPEEYGDYFAWGEVEPKEVYNWSTYKWCNGSKTTITKYCIVSDYGTVDNKTVLDKEDDAATVNMGGSWRIPTYEEKEELINECIWTSSTLNGVNGYNIEGPNGNSIFLPLAGWRDDGNLESAGWYVNYWLNLICGSWSPYCVYCFDFNMDFVLSNPETPRCYGCPVRGVCK